MIEREFINELGNPIKVRISKSATSVYLWAEGPKSEVELIWTIQEAIVLRDILNQLELSND